MLTSQELKQSYLQLKLFKFPQKRWLANFSTSTIETRRRDFEDYLGELVRAVAAEAHRQCRAPSPPLRSYACNPAHHN